ncbi:metallophosphoesterase [Pelagicoccus sp. SDUM812005]|uniref:metallophosphoesterase family protein n=1 Tax=Pelagicoccus sp. SDUM812005 TaxID=3041257 RepID=UPI0028116B68|nr:metallophosphoesterase [Pelagicoccus sp. SDUM812005]
MNVPFVFGGDILIHCGDFYSKGEQDPDLEKLNEWFANQQFRHKFFIPGENDDPVLLDQANRSGKLKEATLLNGKLVEVEGFKIFGASFFSWQDNRRFGLQTLDDVEALANSIPEDLDILATHVPPFGVLDESTPDDNLGCLTLRCRVQETRPYVHAFGHDTGAAGYERFEDMHCYNVAQNWDVSPWPMPTTLNIEPRCAQSSFPAESVVQS